MYQVTLVIHSNYSEPSKKFLKLVEELLDFEASNDTSSDIVVICIDYINGKRPQAYYELIDQIKGIDKVPTLIPKNTTEILAGEKAFEWVETEIRKYKKLPGVSAFPSKSAMSTERFTAFGSQPRSYVPENPGANPGRMKEGDNNWDRIMEERGKLLQDKGAPTNQPAPWTTTV
jgi:hypothetical protein